jgi:murein DD-endopeptidase MepM/ murein hydrolase activator NlpD
MKSLITLLSLMTLCALVISCSSKVSREGQYEIPLKQQLKDAERKAESTTSAPGSGKKGSVPSAGDDTFVPELQIVFPVIGKNSFIDSWGAPRDGHTHVGTDIIAKKMLPVVAVADGVISWVYGKKSGKCCYLAIDHEGDWQTRYIHLNNDTEGTDDGKGNGIAPGIQEDVFVKAGQIIGWVGDSGNAENKGSHLHFEILVHGENVNPYPYLKNAKVIEKPVE